MKFKLTGQQLIRKIQREHRKYPFRLDLNPEAGIRLTLKIMLYIDSVHRHIIKNVDIDGIRLSAGIAWLTGEAFSLPADQFIKKPFDPTKEPGTEYPLQTVKHYQESTQIKDFKL